ncbi:MAG: hypothetical protein J5I93_13600 [Pirellulaceae bacterium]|nr:hypothetical protein [Pirellulaceae bacterium]
MPYHLITLACLAACGQVAPPGTAVNTHLPELFSDDFEQGADGWKPTDPQAWKVTDTGSGKVYDQHQKRSQYEPPHRSPYNISLVQDLLVGDFILQTKVRSSHPDYGHRDVCLVFGYQDPAHFYYVHLGKQMDDHANQIFIVDGKPRTKISQRTTPGTNWDDAWHTVLIVRKVQDGTIQVYFDDLTKPVMVAEDRTFLWGQVGVGSFDDTSQWDDVRVWGRVVKRPEG